MKKLNEKSIGNIAYSVADKRLLPLVPNRQSRSSKAFFFGRMATYYSSKSMKSGEIYTGDTRYAVLRGLSNKKKGENLLSNKNYYYSNHFKILEQAGLVRYDNDMVVLVVTDTEQYFNKMNKVYGTDREAELITDVSPALWYLFLLHYKMIDIDRAHLITKNVLCKVVGETEEDIHECLDKIHSTCKESWAKNAPIVKRIVDAKGMTGDQCIDRIIKMELNRLQQVDSL